MSGERLSWRARPLGAVALFAALALVVGLVAGSSASATGDGATAAKKKCKKKGKKKCKKKGPGPIVLPAPPPIVKPQPQPAPGPPVTNIQHLTLDWNGGADWVDLDLHVWDSDGNHAGTYPGAIPPTVENQIDSASHSGDNGGINGQYEGFDDSFGDERLITIGVCYGNTMTAPTPEIEWTLTFTGVNGATDVRSGTFDTLLDTEVFSLNVPEAYTPTNICDGV